MFATGPPALEALAPYAPTPLRLARPLARTTRTRNETETDFPIELIPSISDSGNTWHREESDVQSSLGKLDAL